MKRKRLVTAILIGSLLGNGIMLFLAGWISQYITNDNIWLKLGGVGGMIVILIVVERYYRSVKKKYLAIEAAEREQADKEKSQAGESSAPASERTETGEDSKGNNESSSDSSDAADEKSQQ